MLGIHPRNLVSMKTPVRHTREPKIERQKLTDTIRERKVKELHALLDEGVYICGSSFDLARQFMPEHVEALNEHMRKTYYGYPSKNR